MQTVGSENTFYVFENLDNLSCLSWRTRLLRHIFHDAQDPDKPQARSGHRMVAFGELVFSVGGYSERNVRSGSGIFKEIWMVNPHTGRWRLFPTSGTGPDHLASHGVVRMGYNLVMFGGSSYPFGTELTNNLYVLSLWSGVWHIVPSFGDVPRALYGQAVVSKGNRLYVIGGTTGARYYMDVHVIDFDDAQPSWVKLYDTARDPQQPKPRYRHEAALYNNSLYIFAGGTDSAEFDVNPLPVFNLATLEWESLQTLPDPVCGYPVRRRAFGFARHNDVVYICGGVNEAGLLADVWRFNLTNNRWFRIKCTLPYSCAFHGCTITEGGCLVVFGGIADQNGHRRTANAVKRWMVPPPLSAIALRTLHRYMRFSFTRRDSPFLEVGKSKTDVVKCTLASRRPACARTLGPSVAFRRCEFRKAPIAHLTCRSVGRSAFAVDHSPLHLLTWSALGFHDRLVSSIAHGDSGPFWASDKCASLLDLMISTILVLFCFAILPGGVYCQALGPQLSTFEKQELFVREGSGFKLACPVVERPHEHPKIQWFKNDVPIPLAAEGFLLSYRNATKMDAGTYYCKASDSTGAILSEAAQVHVAYFKPPVVDTAYRIHARRGSFAVLQPPPIDASPLNKLEWTWTSNGTEVSPSRHVFLSVRGLLVLLNVRESDFGRYTLKVRNGMMPSAPAATFHYYLEPGDRAEESSDDVTIVLKPQNIVHVKSHWAKEAVFECVPYAGLPERINVVWKFKDDRVVDGVSGYRLRNYGRSLVIAEPTDRHEGVYSCEVSWSFHEGIRENAYLSIREAPKVVHFLPNVTHADVGSSVDIFCEFQSKPEASVTWYFNGEDLTEPLQCCSFNLSMLALPNAGLRIVKVGSVHQGIYQCRARNQHGSTIDGTTLRLRGVAPTVALGGNVTVDALTEVVLSCKATGHPKPSVRWLFEGNQVIPSDDHILNGSNLRIVNARGSDTGRYTCLAHNDFGEAEDAMYLSVRETFGIIHGPENEAFVIGSTVVLPCTLSDDQDDEAVSRRWYLRDQLLTPGAVRNIQFPPNGSLIIRQVGPSNIGSYTCEVETPEGRFSKTGFLKIIEKPGMPLRVKATVVNDTLPAHVRLTWSEGFDSNSPIIKYVIEQRLLSVQGTWSEWEVAVDNIGRDQRVAIIEGLKPSSTYEFRVTAVNRLGYGVPSVSSNLAMMPQQPPAAAPLNVAGSARSSSDIMVQWQQPPSDQWNGDILGYIVRYRLAKYPNIPWNYHNISDSRARNWLVSDLITWREYEIQLAAYNERGAGVYSKSMYITTLEGVPTEAPVITNASVINSTAVYVSFRPPDQQMIPGVNLGYKVEAWLGEPGIHPAGLTRVLPDDLNLIECVLPGLMKFVTYNITVLCFTAPGDGPRSQPVEVTTKQDVPEKVKALRVEETFFDSAIIVWESPAHPNGVLLNYTVTYCSLNRTGLNRTIDLPPDITSYKVTGLKPLSHYKVSVLAKTAVGSGPASSVDVVTTVPPEMPGPPSRLVISNPQQRSVSVQFTPGFDGKTIISTWIVEALVGSSSVWQEVFNVSAPRAKSITVTGLRPHTNYTLRLIAENVVGRSAPSAPSSPFETLQDVPEFSPSDFDAQPISDHSIRVTWSPLPKNAWNGEPTGYILFFQPVDDTDYPTRERQVVIENPKASEHILSDLCAACTYRLHMVSSNRIGNSNYSESLSVKTYESEPSKGPAWVNVTAESPTSALVTWGDVPPNNRNGRITAYMVDYQSTGPPTDSGNEVVSEDHQHALVLDNLVPFTSYRVRVAAINGIGLGAYSDPEIVFRTPVDLAGPPSELFFPYVTLNEVRMTWKPPYRPNGLLKRYAVAYWMNATVEQGAVKATLASDLRMFVATGLFPVTAYTFSVAAINDAGVGTAAFATVYTTQESRLPQSPTKPIHISSSPARSDAISIKWDNAEDMRMPIRFSELELQHENSDLWMAWDEKPDGESATISKLKPNSAYRFRVRSVNDHGRSPWSTVSDWMRTEEAEPAEPPQDVSVSSINGTAVQISWSAPEKSTWNADTVGYRLIYRIYGKDETLSAQEFPMTDAFKRQWDYLLTVPELKRFQHYMIQLQTFNHIGSSHPSQPKFVYVGYTVPVSPVNGLHAEAVTSTEVKISWEMWRDELSPISGFKVYYKDLNQNVSMEQDVVDSESGSKLLSGLRKFGNYTVEVRPFNRAGDGPPATVTVQTLPDRPGPIRNLAFHDVLLDSVNISWSPPDEPNGIVMGYRVTYKTFKLDKEFMSQRQEKVIGRECLVVTNLEENVTISFSVEAETVVGYGPAVNDTITLGPQPGSPDPPFAPSLLPKESSVTLEWATSPNANAPIDSFIIQYSAHSNAAFSATAMHNRLRRNLLSSDAVMGNRWQTLAVVDASTNFYTVAYKQLKPGLVYRFRVAARNGRGVSYASAPSDPFTIPEGFNDKPFYLEWWFLVILALILLVIVVIVVAALWVTGNRSKGEKPRSGSNSSLQLSDGGIVTYQLRTSRQNKVRKVPFGNNQYSRYPVLSDDFTFSRKGVEGVERLPRNGDKAPNWYDSVGQIVTNDPNGGKADDVLRSEDQGNLDADVGNIAQHYQNTDSCYKETWRRARQAVHRPNSASLNSDNDYAIRDGSPDVQASINRVPPTAVLNDVSPCRRFALKMGDGQESRIFVSYRALGLVCNSVPAVLRYLVRWKKIKLHTCVGNVVHTFNCPKMVLANVSEPLPAEVGCLAADDHNVYVGCDTTIITLRMGRSVKYTLNGHEAPVRFLLPFGAHLVSVDEKSRVIVWNIGSRSVQSEICMEASLFRITALCHPATYVNKVLFGSEQGSLKLFNLKSNNLIYEFSGWDSQVTVIRQSPAVDVVAIGLLDGRIHVHNLKFDETLITFRHEGAPVRSVAFRTDGPASMISGNDRGELAIWDLEKHQLLMLKEGAHDGAVVSLISLQDEPCIVTTGTDNAAKCWLFDATLGSLRLYSLKEGHSLPPISIQFHGSDGRSILSAGGDGKLKIFDTISDIKNASLGTAALMRRSEARRKGKNFENLRLPPVVFFASSTARENAWDNVICCHEDRAMATTWTSRRCRIGEHKLCHPRFKSDPHLRRCKATCCTVSNCGNFALIGYSSGHVDVYNAQSAIHRGNLQDGTLTEPANRAHAFPIQGICLNSLTQLVITGCTEGRLKIWHFRSKKLLYVHAFEAGIKRLIINHDNDLLAAALDNLSIVVYDIFYRRIIRRFDNSHGAGITDLTFNPSGHWLISSSQDCTVKVWDLPKSSLVDVLSFAHACKSLSMSPTGEYLATCHSERRGIYLWVNKTLYRPQLTLRPLLAGYEPTGYMDLPVTQANVANDMPKEGDPFVTEMEDDYSYSSPEQIEQLCSLSTLPPSRWANLIDLDIIRKRNKPKEPPRKSNKTPFFLTSLPPMALSDESKGFERPKDIAQGSSRIFSFGQLGTKSTFAKHLQSCKDERDYWEAFEMLKSLGPATVHSEILALEPLESADRSQSIHRFLQMVLVVLQSGRCFDVANSYLALFLQVHRELLWRSSEQFAEELQQVQVAQAEAWRRLDNLMTETISMVSFMNATLV
uniref:Protein-tyrosine-phosphatase n=1 Tax=Trichuris muris TaxID=70415 RepID=A0A5S6Q0T3_TRIMR